MPQSFFVLIYQFFKVRKGFGYNAGVSDDVHYVFFVFVICILIYDMYRYFFFNEDRPLFFTIAHVSIAHD